MFGIVRNYDKKSELLNERHPITGFFKRYNPASA